MDRMASIDHGSRLLFPNLAIQLRVFELTGGWGTRFAVRLETVAGGIYTV